MLESEDDYGYYRSVFTDILRELNDAKFVEEAMARTIEGLTGDVIEATGEMDKAKLPPKGSFDYVPINVPGLLRDLRQLDAALAEDPDYACHGTRYRPVRFLEVGCGHGRNLALIRHAGVIDYADLTGFDISEAMIAAGRKGFGLTEEISVADAMTFDYSPYDVIYSYRPFIDDTLQRRYEAHVEKSMKVSAYLLAPLLMEAKPSRRMLKVGTDGNLWKKIA
ncbi:class I SAM-dependent methyltransferase [Frigidibacter sp. ROC022]|uniref:class I SAM-dependent methyltransferase n=1 Tax=Frigidibacter sp. ROC022 TaxID=2971796 RepID=UPI00215B6992|nr:class I SAM-dependent methyltransferase [Frigidibacter sp. ROC022]MCR8723224.1 class I SAM-dependent methyltransferase [Frigidibacter sp. ROC022]